MVSSGSFRNQNHKRKELPDNTWIDSGNYPTKAENFRKDHPAGHVDWNQKNAAMRVRNK